MRYIKQYLFILFLIFIGFRCFLTSYNWEGKGKKNNITGKYLWTSPEVEYLKKAKGKFFIPFMEGEPWNHHSDWTQNPNPPDYITGNFALLYGYYGPYGFLSLGNYRYSNFIRNYRSKNDRMSNRFDLSTPSNNFSTYLPIDFTIAREEVTWPGFKKVIQGSDYSIWERNPSFIYRYTKKIECTDLKSMINNFDEKNFYSNPVIYIEENDCKEFNLKDTDLTNTKDWFLFTPEIYQEGWTVKVNNKVSDYFPANYIFIGVKSNPGDKIVMQYSPPLLFLGLFINFITLSGAIFYGKFINSD